MLFNVVAEKSSASSLKMLTILQKPNFDFLGKRAIAAILSVGLIAATWSVFLAKGDENFGVDFTGGKSLVFSFSEKQAVADVRDTLAGADIQDAYIQYQSELTRGEGGDPKELLEVKVGFEEGDAAKDVLLGTYENADFKVVKEDSVGPQVGEELKRKGITAIIVALIGIVIYISFRFEFAFAMGAIVALAHDVLITVGIYCLCGRQLSLPIVAALLTIVGYSVNDTIVVFDRVREDLRLMKGRPYAEIANLSINQTLSRTLLTSLTTLLSVLVLLVFGGGAIYDFALALLIGVAVGTYSSIFVATPVMLLWHSEKKDTKKA
jgi:preprotein translocase SecF subunit